MTSYPVVSDSIETFKSNPYGAKSLEVADGAYSRFGKPFVPYLRTPYSYAAPYVAKADSIADASLNTVDNHFPIVKEDTQTLYDSAKSWAFWPFQLADDGKNYVFSTYNDEYKKTASRNNRGEGLTTFFMALVSTELKVASDALAAAANYLGPKKDEAKQHKDQFISQAKQKKDGFVSESKKTADSFANDARKTTDSYANDAKKTTDSYANEAKKTKDQYAQKAQEKAQ